MDAIRALEEYNVRVYRNAKETGRQLGVGSFGSVVELKIKGVGKFAGKKLHEALIIPGDTSRLVKECKLMSGLLHPNIAKFCGVCKLPTSTFPALVMELMDHSLEEIIERKSPDFPLETAISVFIDIANGLAYLHSRNPQILHRDLTARNVLLYKSMKAKITDFGNSRIVDATRLSKTMTHYPGTLVYMPPEALDVHSKYGDRLDIFSFGHLVLYAIIREFPKNLLAPTYTAPDGKLAARTEIERRNVYMEMLNNMLPVADHDIYRLTKQCLHNDPTKRPASTELLHCLQDIQRREKGEEDLNDFYETCDGATEDERQRDVNRHSMVNESEGPTQCRKRGLIEKKSAGLKGGWRAYSFTLDYEKGTLKYTRSGAFAKSPQVQLDSITRIEELQSDGTRFPFEVHFAGKNSPWELNVYSEADRRDWKVALQQNPNDMQTQGCIGHTTATYDEIPAADPDFALYEELDYVEVCKPCVLPLIQPNHPNPVTMPTNDEPEPIYFETCLNKPLPPIPLSPNHPNSLTTPSSDDQPDTANTLISNTSGYATVSTDVSSNDVCTAVQIPSPPSSTLPLPPIPPLPPTTTKSPSGSNDECFYEGISPPSSTDPLPSSPPLPPTTTKAPSGNNDGIYEATCTSLPYSTFHPSPRLPHTTTKAPSGSIDDEGLPIPIPSPPSSTVPLPPCPLPHHLQLPPTTTKTPSGNNDDGEEPYAPIGCTDYEGVYAIMPTDIPSGNTEGEDVYEEIVHFLKEKLDPSQMDAIAIMLQRMKQSVHPEVTSPPANSATPIYPPPTSDPQLAMNLSPEVVDYNGSEEDEPEPTHSSTRPAASKHKSNQRLVRPPLVITELNPSVSNGDLRAFGKLVKDKDVMADEKLLITGDDYEARPTWAIAQQDPPTSLTPLEVLHKESLYISESSLSDITKIGEGKFGEVFKAEMRTTTVAIKVTKKYSSEKAMCDFQNEMSIMSEVAHHNIVRLYGVISEGDLSPALVMEFLPLGNLLTFLRREQQPDLSLLKYMNDVAMGMHYLGERGLIHRDLAARNVLVDQNRTCKVSDFGLLREVPRDNSIYVSTYQGPSPLRWMPPESLSDKIFSPASDVWSFGILQWEMFNPDRIPYHDMEDTQMAVKVTSGYRMPIPRGCPGIAAKIMRACWQHSPRKRPSFLLISNLLTQRLLAL